MSKIHLCDSCLETESCDWYKYCGMNTPVFECNSYIEKSSAKVVGRGSTSFDSRFMPNVKFKIPKELEGQFIKITHSKHHLLSNLGAIDPEGILHGAIVSHSFWGDFVTNFLGDIMNKYLERVKDGCDAKVIIVELEEKLKERDIALNDIFNIVAKGGDVFTMVSDIINRIPTECLQKNSN